MKAVRHVARGCSEGKTNDCWFRGLVSPECTLVFFKIYYLFFFCFVLFSFVLFVSFVRCLLVCLFSRDGNGQ